MAGVLLQRRSLPRSVPLSPISALVTLMIARKGPEQGAASVYVVPKNPAVG
jgi:hypothetical protein